MKVTLAGDERLTRLYHYERYSWDWLSQTLLGGRIFLSDTKNFNDPWDCRPCFDLSRLDDPVFYERQVAWFDRSARKRTPNLTEHEYAQKANSLRRDRSLLESCIRQMGGLDIEIQKRYRVYCLTIDPTSMLMWSHYASNHSGICLEFGCDNSVFSGALKVFYCDSYPTFELADEDASSVLLPLMTKANVWSYESEYRLVAQEEEFAVSRTLITQGNLLRIPDTALKSIIIGCSASSSQRDNIRDLLRLSGRKIALKRTVRIANRYELAIEDT